MKNATRKSGRPASGRRGAIKSRKKTPSARPGPQTTSAAELKQSQEALRAEINLNSAILDASASHLLVVVLDPEGRIVRFNRACQELTGYSEDEVTGKRFWDFLLIRDEIAGVKVKFEEIRKGTPNRHQNYWLTKDGRRRLISWSNNLAKRNGAVEYVIGTGIDVTERHEAEQQAREQATTVQALMESATQAILASDPQGRIVLANAATEAMYGYSRRELMGLTIDNLLPERLRKRHVRHRANWFARPQNRYLDAGLNLVGRRKDGSEFPVEVSLSHIETKDGILGVSFVSDITERKKAQTALLKSQQELRDLAGRLLSIQEAGTRLLARELHDDLSQKLVALSMEASALSKSSFESPEVISGRIRKLGQKIGGLADDVHQMSRQLHPAILDDLGLEAALKEECTCFSQRLGIPVRFKAKDVPRSIPGDIALCLFRVAQESLRNIGKHAGATEVRVRLTVRKADLALFVEDIGNGFDVEHARGKGGLGLISMEERVRLVNGDFKIRSQPGEGTVVEVRVPVPEKAS